MVKSIKLNSGYEIPQIGLGVFLVPESGTTDLVYQALEIGYRHIDSAQFYKNEAEVVEAIAKFLKLHPEVKRSDIFYTTKFSLIPLPEDYDEAYAAVKLSVEIAKKIEYIDLFLIHSCIGTTKARLNTYKALQPFVEAGQVRSLGVSNYGVDHLKELLNWDGLKVKPSINQIELNPWLTRKEVVDYAQSQGIHIELYSPLTRGYRLNDPDLLKLAEKYGRSPAQILLRWSIQKGFIVLPKASSAGRLKENLSVEDFELSEEDFKWLTHDEDYYVSIPQWDPIAHPDPEYYKDATFEY